MGVNFTLASVLERHALDPRRRDRPAFTQGAQTRTFAELYDRARRLAAALPADPGDRVAVLMGNRLEWVDVLFGVTGAGAVCVPVNVLLSSADVVAVVADADPRVLVADAHAAGALAALARADALPPTIVTVGDVETPSGAHRVGLDTLLSAPGGPLGHGVEPGAPAMMYYTSGTTGAPKAAVHTHHGLLWNTAHQIPDLAISSDETFLVVPSLSWGAGFHDITLALFWAGGTSEILPTGRGTLERVVGAIEAARVDRALLVPTLLRDLLAAPELLERLRASPLTRIMSGAEPLHAATSGALTEALPAAAITQTYGMTEFPMFATMTRPEEAVTHAGRAGRASSITTLALRSEDGGIVAEGEGEIVLRSPATTTGYYERPEENAAVFRDGWFHTGDLGRLDPDGYLTVTGRTKDMIITGGLNIAPREIEDVVAGAAGVREVAVVGVPDPRFGEAPVAVVVTSTADDPSEVERAVLRACEEGLSGFKRPRRVVVGTDPLPTTVTGKVLKRELRDRLVEE